ncbi:hypothetical protein [Serratia marcescens]|uniref:hypothetical protein n=1 Tax=Serratia marcescens TaxID=615 RepID=UPI003159AA15
MDNKLSELSKPVAWSDERRNLCTNTIKERGLNSKYHQDYEKYSTPIYSQEYVSALLAELEAKDEQNKLLMREVEHGKKLRVNMQNNADSLSERIAELEAKLAAPVRLPDTRQSVSGERYQWSDGVFNYKQDAIAMLRAAGFKVEGDEQ